MNIEQFLASLPIAIEDTLIGTLGMTFTELSKERVVCTMPVNEKTRQPIGLLHGGASVALAETAASIGAFLHIDPKTQFAAGLEINANHIRGKRDGIVTAIATPLHIGRTTMVWHIEIVDEQHKVICISRCTIAIGEQK
ncbi:hotdog fold thioesterase [Caryophanon tenue]|uniref:hotdog fold thioesterase n=1 Tax=Caryophanon tenue TaxID=33978 RepID=UPI000AF2CF00|nr:hotdog fold thioesterase [Caryophanon tenue]